MNTSHLAGTINAGWEVLQWTSMKESGLWWRSVDGRRIVSPKRAVCLRVRWETFSGATPFLILFSSCQMHPTKQEVHPTFRPVHPTCRIVSKWPTFSWRGQPPQEQDNPQRWSSLFHNRVSGCYNRSRKRVMKILKESNGNQLKYEFITIEI